MPSGIAHQTRAAPRYSRQLENACGPARPSVCDGHEDEIICVHNFLPREQALQVRDRLDLLTKQRASGALISKSRVHRRVRAKRVA